MRHASCGAADTQQRRVEQLVVVLFHLHQPAEPLNAVMQWRTAMRHTLLDSSAPAPLGAGAAGAAMLPLMSNALKSTSYTSSPPMRRQGGVDGWCVPCLLRHLRCAVQADKGQVCRTRALRRCNVMGSLRRLSDS